MRLVTKLAFYGKAAWAMYVRRQARLAYLPEYVALEVTNVCNFRCVFCPQSDPTHHDLVPRTYLDPLTCEDFLKKVRQAGIRTNLLHWTLDGEPFVNKQFADLVKVSARYGFKNTYFASNGMLATIDRLIDFPLDDVRLNIAIDFCADKTYFEEVRGTKDSWERVKINVSSILSDKRTQNVGIELTDISSFSKHSPQEQNRLFREMKDMFGHHKNINYRTRTFHNATGFIAGKKNVGRYHLCPYPWTHLRIASNGDVVICCRDLNHKTVLGNLKTQTVHEIWNGSQAVNARQALLMRQPESVDACRGCDLPYDDSKFTLRNVYRAARGRMQIFSK